MLLILICLKDLDQRLPSKAVDSLLELELRNNGISADYDFVVYDAVGAPVFYKNENSANQINDPDQFEISIAIISR